MILKKLSPREGLEHTTIWLAVNSSLSQLIKTGKEYKLLKAYNFKNKSASVEIFGGEAGISPGQACVFYSKDSYGDKLLGGGWIHKTVNKNLST